MAKDFVTHDEHRAGMVELGVELLVDTDLLKKQVATGTLYVVNE